MRNISAALRAHATSPLVLVATVLSVSIAGPAGAQATSTIDPVIARAQQRAAASDSAGGRAILDSLQAAKLENAASHAEVTYWQARFAKSPADREHFLTMLVVDYPFSPRVGPALFELGMLELSHADRERAATHLARFLTTAEEDTNRTAASLALGRILFDRGEPSRACAVLLAARAEVPATAVEARNQFDFAVGPCRGVDTSIARPAFDTAHSVIGEYTVQVAAYDLRIQADRLATRLRGEGLEARVIGRRKPFRVRVGHFVTRAEADKQARRIGILTNSKPFVVMVGTEEM